MNQVTIIIELKTRCFFIIKSFFLPRCNAIMQFRCNCFTRFRFRDRNFGV